MSDKEKGLYQKYHVARTDGSSEIGGKHENCAMYVLDLTHDPHARKALKYYVESCAEDYPQLEGDLLLLLEIGNKK